MWIPIQGIVPPKLALFRIQAGRLPALYDFCAEICTRGGGDECRSDDAICEAHPFLSLDVCIPAVFFSGG